MRIIVADDMPMQVREIAEGIGTVWPDWEILTATDGQEILRMVSAQKIDIVLSDIRMPHMDGLEMLPIVRKISPETKVVFITAYPLFEYAQRALKLGATDFLLKPVDLNALYDLLSQLSRESGKDDLLRDEIRLWLEQDWQKLTEETRRHISECFPSGCVCAIVAPASNPFPQPRHLAEEIGRMTGCTVIAADARSTSEVFRYALVCAEDAWHCENFLRMLPTAAMRHGFRAGMTKFCKNLARDGRTQWQLALAGAEKGFYESTSVALAETAAARAFSRGIALPSKQRLIAWMSEPGGWKNALKEWIDSVRRERPNSEELVGGMLRLLRDTAAMLARDDEKLKQDLHIGEPLQQVMFFSEFALCTESAMKAMEKLYQSSIERADPIEMAMDYVRRNYQEPITLTDVAEMTHLSPNYFSTLFRKRTNMRFMEYVLKVRLEKASDMLANTEMYVYEIANACGYEDVRYFVRVYQKAYGITPANFRRYFRKDRGKEKR